MTKEAETPEKMKWMEYGYYAKHVEELEQKQKEISEEVEKLKTEKESMESAVKKASGEFSRLKQEIKKAKEELEEAKKAGMEEVEKEKENIGKILEAAKKKEAEITEEKAIAEEHRTHLQKKMSEAKLLLKKAEDRTKVIERAETTLAEREKAYREEKQYIGKLGLDLEGKEEGLNAREAAVKKAEEIAKETEKKAREEAKEADIKLREAEQKTNGVKNQLEHLRSVKKGMEPFIALAKELKMFIIQNTDRKEEIEKRLDSVLPPLE